MAIQGQMEDYDKLDFDMTQEVDAPNVVKVQEPNFGLINGFIDGIYAPIRVDVIGGTQLLECSEMQLMDCIKKSGSTFDEAIARRKKHKLSKGEGLTKAKKVRPMVETKMHKVDVDETCLGADKYVHQVNDELTDCQDGNKVLQVKDMATNVHSVALLIGGASNVEAAVTKIERLSIHHLLLIMGVYGGGAQCGSCLNLTLKNQNHRWKHVLRKMAKHKLSPHLCHQHMHSCIPKLKM